MSKKIDEIIDIISQMNILEVVELTKAIEKKFDISAVNFQQGPQVEKGSEEKSENKNEKNEFSVIMTSFGNSKLNVIKTIRTMLDLPKS